MNKKLILSGTIVLVVVLWGVFMAVADLSPAKKLVESSEVLVIAHRGASRTAPENTLAAFEQAVESGADLIELDYFHANGKMIVIHDEFVGEVHIPKASSVAIQALDVSKSETFAAAYTQQKTPTLEQAIDVILPRAVPLIEYKRSKNQTIEESQQQAKELLEFLNKKNVLQNVVVQSFDPYFLLECRKHSTKVVLGWLIWEKPEADKFEQMLDQLQPQIVGWKRHTLDQVTLAYLQERKLKVWVWFSGEDKANDPMLALDSIKFGIDGLITDHPGDVRALVDWYKKQ